SVTLIEADRPNRIRPSSDQYRTHRCGQQLPEQLSADAFVLLAGSHVRVPDQGHFAHVLDSHDTEQRAIFFIAPKLHTRRDLMLQLFTRHVGIAQAIRGNASLIGSGSIVDDGPDRFEISVAARTK